MKAPLALALLLAAPLSAALAPAQVIPWKPSTAPATAPQKPATAQQYAQWRAEIKKALFIPDPLPAPAPHLYGTFSPTPGVIAERVSYASLYGMRIPAIVYRPEKLPAARVPAIVVVNGHGGDKTSWYAYYTGILYARAGAVVVTYDPIGEDERDIDRRSASRAHDTFVPGDQLPQRLGGTMVADILLSVSYLLQRPDVDPARVAILGFSMGSFHSALAGAIDPRVHAVILSGGGNLGDDHSYWAQSPKVMCQSGPYKALSFLGDRAAIVYALQQHRGPTLIMNGMVDPLIVGPNTFEPFFAELRDRTAAISGTRTNLFETWWSPNAGHRPNFITRDGAIWLNRQLHFPNWTDASVQQLPQIHISAWFARNPSTTARVPHSSGGDSRAMSGKNTAQLATAPIADPPGATISNQTGEGGLFAVDANVPLIPRDQLQAIPDADWQTHKADFIYPSFMDRIKAAAASDTHHP
ncbi:MAG TPA: prolyl oligopeptidase family serine peptidase [Acidobacteriaceae bacterium]|nr:prolyl oligopeptidase family serine peptidase [Acidobacteriaceae bacterium]